MEKAIIIRYCEIHLKGKNRAFFEKMLKDNIKASLKGIKHNFVSMHSRYLITDFNDQDYYMITDKLKKISGIHTFSLAYVCENNIDKILELCLCVLQDKVGTFKVVTNRADKTFVPNSMETSILLGGRILDVAGDRLKVDVKNPDYFVYVDIREDGKTFVYTDVVHALSGMPVGSAGKGLMLISGGIDSPVASYQKQSYRGYNRLFVFFQ